MKKILVIMTMVLGFSAAALSQGATASADASATIITPIAISHVADMNFGNVAVSATLGGTVVLTPAGGRSATSGVTLPAGAGTVTAAAFTVTGVAGVNFLITLPGSVTISNGGNNMTVNTFTCTPTSPAVLTGGSVSLTVGATLNVTAAQPAGIYTTATPFDVTVNYQ
jgi:hypothetical protein